MRLFENQLDRDFAVLNADDPEVTKRMPSRSHVFWFSRQKRVAEGAFLLDDQIIFRNEGSETAVGRRREIPLRGEHNVENVLAACAAAYLAGAPPAAIASGVKTFSRRRASPGIRRRDRRRCVLQRFESHQRGRRAQSRRSVSRPADRDSRRQGQGQPVHAAARGASRTRGRVALLIGEAAEKIAADLGDAVPCVPCRHARTRRADRHRSARGRATRCCSLRRARASTSSKITSIAAAHSSSWWRRLRKRSGRRPLRPEKDKRCLAACSPIGSYSASRWRSA